MNLKTKGILSGIAIAAAMIGLLVIGAAPLVGALIFASAVGASFGIHMVPTWEPVEFTKHDYKGVRSWK